MRTARGVVEATVAGKARRLRLSLEAIDEMEVRTGQPWSVLALSLGDDARVRVGHLIAMFECLCQAGGTPLSAEDRSDLMPSDAQDLAAAIEAACTAAGAIERAEGASEKKAGSKPRRKPPGTTGRKSPSVGSG